jgi:hypothetical protein
MFMNFFNLMYMVLLIGAVFFSFSTSFESILTVLPEKVHCVTSDRHNGTYILGIHCQVMSCS